MANICPTITAYDLEEYRRQINQVAFAERIHIDLMDGEFAPTTSPPLEQIWLPPHKTCDIHLMYQKPMDSLQQLIRLRPSLVVIHNEAAVHHMHFAAELHKEGIKAGLALLADTPVSHAQQIMHSFDHILIFSGHLGYHGGETDLSLLDKVRQVRTLHPEAEIGWDGGINDENAQTLLDAGVDILNVGDYVQHASNPAAAYGTLKALVQ